MTITVVFARPFRWNKDRRDVQKVGKTMRNTNSFPVHAGELMDAWIRSIEDAPAADLLAVFSKLTRPNTVLLVIDMTNANPMDFVVDFVSRYRLATTFSEMSTLQTNGRFRDFPDQQLIGSHLIPFFEDVRQKGRPVLAEKFTTVSGWGVSFEALAVPQKCRPAVQSSWCIGLVGIKFLLPPSTRRLKYDDIDLGILQLLREGLSTKEIGLKILLSHRTVEHRLERLKALIGARSLAHLVALSVMAELGDVF